MKRSRLLLGITAFTLAVASAIAAKAKSANVTYYYTTGVVPNVCVTLPLPARTDCTPGGTGCFFTVTGGIQYQLYSEKASNACIVPLEPI